MESEYRSEFEERVAGDRDAMDPFVYDLYHAVRYVEEFGGEAQNVRYVVRTIFWEAVKPSERFTERPINTEKSTSRHVRCAVEFLICWRGTFETTLHARVPVWNQVPQFSSLCAQLLTYCNALRLLCSG